ncbi:MAG TPA: restriction endonuclease subunit S [Chthoniobacterales bacterium]|nr:restriction endonuclease subunit S [Chthoniobacterales bacterium]
MNAVTQPNSRTQRPGRLIPLNRIARHHSGNSKLIKGKLHDTPAGNLFPAFSASGQDVWHSEFDREGDAIIISAVGARCGKCFLARGRWSAIANTHVVWPDPEKADLKFLWYLLNDEQFWIRSGSAQPFVAVRKTFEKEIFVPPVSEQRRIVGEIEKQLTRLDAGLAALRRAQLNLKRYRQSYLGSIIPGAWPLLPIGQIGETVTGSTPPTKDPQNFGGTLPFLKPTDLNSGYRVEEAREHLTGKGAALARVLPENTVLVTCIGATIGKTGLARVRSATNQQINALIPHDNIATPEWLFWALTSTYGQRQVRENASATTLPILNKTRFQGLEFPIPPLATQVELVAEIEKISSIVDKTEAVAAADLLRADRLRQSILQKAFSGEL